MFYLVILAEINFSPFCIYTRLYRMSSMATTADPTKKFYSTFTYEELYRYVHEDYTPSNNLWFMTFTIDPKLYKMNAMTQFEMTVNEIRSILENHVTQYTISTELTEQGNVHYHAIGIIKDKFGKITLIDKIKRKRMFGFMKINSQPIHTDEMLKKSCNYIIKELDQTQKILCRPNYKPDLIYIKNCR